MTRTFHELGYMQLFILLVLELNYLVDCEVDYQV